MPTSIEQLETTFNLNYLESLKWGTSSIENNNGIYIISTGEYKEYLPDENVSIAFKDTQLDLWMKNAPDILLNGNSSTKEELINHLKGFWLPDETILYIGKAENQTLSERICQFYSHKVGKRSPHKGGYWIKLLNNLDDLYIHLYSTNDSHSIEEKLLNHFIENVSESTKESLIDNKWCLPFANLQLRSRVIKAHGLKNHYI